MQKNNNKKNPKHIFSFSLGENTVKTELSYSVPSLHKNSSHVATQTKLFIPAFLSANAFYEFAPASFTWTQRILAFSRDTNSRINRGFLLVWLTLSWNDELTDQKVHFLIISVFFFFFLKGSNILVFSLSDYLWVCWTRRPGEVELRWVYFLSFTS